MLIISAALTILFFSIVGLLVYRKLRLPQPDRHNLQEDIKKELQQKFMSRGICRQMVVGVYKQGKSLSMGFASGSNEVPDVSGLFELASASKLFTAITYKVLLNENRIAKHCTIADVIGQDIPLSDTVANIRLQDLATHRSGLPPLPKAFLRKMKNAKNPYADLELEDLTDYLGSADDTRSAGKFNYSNLGMGILGYLMQKQTNTEFETLVSRKLLEPLEMHNTVITPSAEQTNRIVQGFNNQDEEVPIWEDKVLTGAGSFIANMPDVLKFIEAHFSEPEFELQNSLTESLEANFGWLASTLYDRLAGNGEIRWHNGISGGYGAYIAISPQEKTGVAVLCNKAIDPSIVGITLMRLAKTQSWD